MAGPAAELRSLLWGSEAVYAALVDGAGRIVDANPALTGRADRSLAGTPLADLVTAPQRRALQDALDRAGAEWAGLTLTFYVAGGATPEDRTVRLLRCDDAVLVVAEPERLARDQLLEQVLELNDELVTAQRAIGRRQRELERSRAEAHASTQRASQLEAITLAGLTRPRTEDALEVLLDTARSILGTDGAAVLLLDEASSAVRVRAALGLRAAADDGAAAEIARTGAARIAEGPDGSLAGVPLRLDGAVIGVLQVASERAAAFVEADLGLLDAVGERAALTIGHAQLRERERGISETLQRSLLPDRLPEVPGVTLVARYLPRVESVQVGGDFYDAAVVPGGSLSLAIGDVAGKGLRAAALMGHLRSALRAYAVDGHGPEAVLARLDRLVLEADDYATALHLVLDPDTGAGVYAVAGHPPMLRIPAAGPPGLVAGTVAPPLGIGMAAPDRQALELGPGEALVLFTDGLFERRGEDPDERLAALCTAFAVGGDDLGARCDGAIAALAGRGFEDDVAVLAVRREAG